MNRTSLWVVILVTGAWIGFMLGFSVSAHTGTKSATIVKPAAGGYGCVPQKKPAAPTAAPAESAKP